MTVVQYISKIWMADSAYAENFGKAFELSGTDRKPKRTPKNKLGTKLLYHSSAMLTQQPLVPISIKTVSLKP